MRRFQTISAFSHSLDPKPTSDALRRSRHEATGFLPFGWALDFDKVSRMDGVMGFGPSRNAQNARPRTSAAAMNIPVAAPPADKATADCPNSRTRPKAAGAKAQAPYAMPIDSATTRGLARRPSGRSSGS
jgi:hypothetical protein